MLKLANLNKGEATEQILVNKFLDQDLPHKLFKKNTIVLKEPKLPTGFPDIIICSLRNNYNNQLNRRAILNADKLKLLHYIYLARGVKAETIQQKLLFPKKTITESIFNFQKNGLISINNGIIRLRPIEDIFLINRIVAIEAKLRNWKQAIFQANRNKWFASESYILMPGNSNFDSSLDFARERGVGVLKFHEKVKVLIKSSKKAIPNSYASWIINELIYNKLISNVQSRRSKRRVS